VAKDSDQSAGIFETEKTGGLAGLLAEENGFDRRLLWRTGTWGAAAVAAVILAAMANQSSIGWRRGQIAASDLVRQAQQLQMVTKESLNETRRLAAAIDTLDSDRDRLYSRVTVLEQGLDSVTGAIARQSSAGPTAAPQGPWPAASKSPVPSAAPASSAPTDSSPVAAIEEAPVVTAAAAPAPPVTAAAAPEKPRMEIAKLEPKPDVKLDAKLDTKPDARLEPKPRPEAKSDSKAEKPESKPEPKGDVKAEIKSDIKPEIKTDPTAGPKPEVRSVASKGDSLKGDSMKPDPSKSDASKFAPRPELKPEAKSEVKLEAKPETKSKVEPKSESRAEKRAEAKIEPKIEAKPEQNAGPVPPPTAPAARAASVAAPNALAPPMTTAAPATAGPVTSLMGPPDPAAGKFEAATPANPGAAPASDAMASVSPKDNDASEAASAKLAVQRTEFAVDLGTANSVNGLRALWRGLRFKTELAELHPIIVVKEGNTGLGMQLRLAAGPLQDAAAAAKICARLVETERPCETTVFDGQRLAMSADDMQAPLAGGPASAMKSAPNPYRRNTPRHVANQKEETAPKPDSPSTSSSSFSLFGGSRH
jgi:hypothetical protein